MGKKAPAGGCAGEAPRFLAVLLLPKKKTETKKAHRRQRHRGGAAKKTPTVADTPARQETAGKKNPKKPGLPRRGPVREEIFHSPAGGGARKPTPSRLGSP